MFSPAGQMSIGVAEAFDEAGRLEEVTMSPGDEYNGWLKWVAEHGQGGAVTFPTRVGQEAVQVGLEILKGEPVERGLVGALGVHRRRRRSAELLRARTRPDDWWASTLPQEFLPKSEVCRARGRAPGRMALLETRDLGQAFPGVVALHG